MTDASELGQQTTEQTGTGEPTQGTEVPPGETGTLTVEGENLKKGDEVVVTDEAPDAIAGAAPEAYEHPEPVSFATVHQDNVSEPGKETTHHLQRTADGGVEMVTSVHETPAPPVGDDVTVEGDVAEGDVLEVTGEPEPAE